MLLSSSAIITVALLLVLGEPETVARSCQLPPQVEAPLTPRRRVGVIPTLELSLDYAPQRVGEVHGDLELFHDPGTDGQAHHHHLTGLRVWSVSLRWQGRAAQDRSVALSPSPHWKRRRSLCAHYDQLSLYRPQSLQELLVHWSTLAQIEALLIGPHRRGELR